MKLTNSSLLLTNVTIVAVTKNKKGQYKNTALVKIQYPMKNYVKIAGGLFKKNALD